MSSLPTLLTTFLLDWLHCIGYRKNMPCHNLTQTSFVINLNFCNPSENPLLIIIQVFKKVWYIEIFRKGINSLNIANLSLSIFPCVITHRPNKTRLCKIFLIFLSDLLHLLGQNLFSTWNWDKHHRLVSGCKQSSSEIEQLMTFYWSLKWIIIMRSLLIV